METQKVVQSLTNEAKRSMDVPRMAYTQGGRVLIGCDNILLAKEIALPHRITLWDAGTGAIAHSVSLPSGRPSHLDVTPNGRYLLAVIDDGEAGLKLSAWRLDGETLPMEPGTPPPASIQPRRRPPTDRARVRQYVVAMPELSPEIMSWTAGVFPAARPGSESSRVWLPMVAPSR